MRNILLVYATTAYQRYLASRLEMAIIPKISLNLYSVSRIIEFNFRRIGQIEIIVKKTFFVYWKKNENILLKPKGIKAFHLMGNGYVLSPGPEYQIVIFCSNFIKISFWILQGQIIRFFLHF